MNTINTINMHVVIAVSVVVGRNTPSAATTRILLSKCSVNFKKFAARIPIVCLLASICAIVYRHTQVC